MFCASCGEELKLTRSTPRYKQMGCPKGVFGVHGCRLSSSKSTRVIEECLLQVLRDTVLAQGHVEEMVAKANKTVEREARKPQADTAPLKAKARKLETTIDKLMKRVEDTTDDELCDVYDERISKLRKDLKKLNTEIREAESCNAQRPKPLPMDQAMAYLADFRKSMNAEIPVAAEAIRKLTGPIMIRQEQVPGRPGDRWIATFSPDFIRVSRDAASETDSTVLAIENDVEPTPVEVVIDKVPKYEQLAPQFKQMHDNGASIEAIAHAHGMSWQYAKDILGFAETGERPKWRSGKATGKGGNPTKYLEIKEEVARLRDEKRLPFGKIATQMEVGYSTVPGRTTPPGRKTCLMRPSVARSLAAVGTSGSAKTSIS